MKTWAIFTILFLFIAFSARMNAQCCSKSKNELTHSLKADAVQNAEGKQEATIVVKAGYSPDTIRVKKGIPVHLNFDLQEKSCTGTVIFKDFNIKQKLTPFKMTSIDFTPGKTGSFTFSCPMDMFRGTLVVID